MLDWMVSLSSAFNQVFSLCLGIELNALTLAVLSAINDPARAAVGLPFLNLHGGNLIQKSRVIQSHKMAIRMESYREEWEVMGCWRSVIKPSKIRHILIFI